MNKRAVSPLVATLILIMFSIALGALVMNWGKAYIEERAEFVASAGSQPLSCDSVDLRLIQVGGVSQLCTTPNLWTLRADLENDGVSVDNVQLRVVGSNSVMTSDRALPSPLARGDSRTVEFNYAKAGQLRQVRITPSLMISGQLRLCAQKAIVIDEPFRTCS
ncbi:hypothetical protein HY641_02610 [Candidatus Woesearchaeota archaeon]|nr:hypothetical protein [Candidatus Woesearchaeota archaeon]